MPDGRNSRRRYWYFGDVLDATIRVYGPTSEINREPHPDAIEARVLSETVQGEFVPSERTDIACQPSTDDRSGPQAAPQGPIRPDFDDLHHATDRVGEQ